MTQGCLKETHCHFAHAPTPRLPLPPLLVTVCSETELAMSDNVRAVKMMYSG